jgi:SAM-dependent methyltransferase
VIAGELAKNLAARVLGPMRERSRALGIEGDPAVAVAALSRMAPGLAALGRPVRDARMLELGPGRTPELMVASILAGARSAAGVDTSMQVPTDAGDPERYRPLLEELTGVAAGPTLAALGTTADAVRERFAELRGGVLPIELHAYDGAHLPLGDASVDLILSKSVLEHVRLAQVDTLLAETARVLAPGGGMVHAIDLRDHRHIDGDDRVHGDWLDALRYPQPLFDAMFSHRATSINRLRDPQWRERFAAQGLEVVSWEATEYPLPGGFDPRRLREPWDELDLGTLSIGFIHVAARRV